MTNEKFTKVFNRRIVLSEKVLVTKGIEYSRDGDRLHNFKSAGEMSGDVPEKALFDMMLKHIVSIKDMVNDINMIDHNIFGLDVWDEKIGDAINYLILLEGLIHERIEEELI